MLEGDAEQMAARDRRGAARTGSSGELMGDVLVYVDPPINDRLLAFARPLADAAGGALVALVAERRAGGRRCARGGRRGARGRASRALPLPPGGAPGGARGGDQGALAGPRAAREHHGRLRPRRRGGGSGGPSLRRLLPRPVAGGRRGGVDQRALRRAAPGHGAHDAAGGVRDQLGRAARRAAPASAAASASSSRRRPSWTSLRTTFIEPVAPPGRGRGPDDGRPDRLRRPRDRGRREHRDRGGAGLRAGRRARRVAAGHRFGLGAQGAADREVRRAR